eukprot:12406057-Karenia_brevis.AAC.1
MLRHVMRIIEDLRSIGQEIPFKRLLAEAFFVVNELSFYNGVSPYIALTGRQPPFLPDMENVSFPKKGEPTPEREEKIRHASIEAITQSTSIAK